MAQSQTRIATSPDASLFANYESDGKKLSIDINDVDVSFVNSIRRTIFTHIPNVGFYFKLDEHYVTSNTTIMVNDSPIHNEFLSHRLSLIPLHLTVDDIVNWTDTQYKFVLKAENTSAEIMNVTTEHFTIYDDQGELLPTKKVREIFPMNPITKQFILITKLHPGSNDKPKKIHIELIATKGTAKDCICWSTISQCTYFNKVDEDLVAKRLEEYIEVEKENGKRTIEDITNEFNTLERLRCFHKNRYDEPNAFTFLLESECMLTPEYIFFKAGRILIEQLEALSVEMAKDDESDVVSIFSAPEVNNFYTISVKGHTHTIANLLQSNILNMGIRDDDKNNKDLLEYKLVYVGYNVPHPLEEMFQIKFKFDQDTSRRKMIEFFLLCLIRIKGELIQIMRAWVEYTLLYKQNINEVAEFN
jgi:DNA-directed RNA polymerase subunit L/DNA-directed RNA polymerase alpha subunit